MMQANQAQALAEIMLIKGMSLSMVYRLVSKLEQESTQPIEQSVPYAPTVRAGKRK